MSSFNNCLQTDGVGPCLCITLQGTIEEQPFIFIHHWPGFSDRKRRKDSWKILNLTSSYFHNIATTYEYKFGELYDEAKILLDQVVVLGGQKAEYDLDGELSLTGTTREVDAIRAYKPQALRDTFSIAKTFRFAVSPYLTKNLEELKVRLSGDGVIKYAIKTERLKEEDETEKSILEP